MSYPLSGTLHVAHGEANYAVFSGVIHNYLEIYNDGAIRELSEWIGIILSCSPDQAFDQMFLLLDRIITRKKLKEYGADSAMLEQWTEEVLIGQKRLMNNNFVPLDRERIHKIYREIYQ